jgi:hypothetical protein
MLTLPSLNDSAFLDPLLQARTPVDNKAIHGQPLTLSESDSEPANDDGDLFNLSLVVPEP